MTIERMEHVGIVVDDLAAATQFFVELGLELQGEAPVEGRWVDRVVGLEGNRHAPANAPGIRHIAFAVEDIDTVVPGLRARGFGSLGSWNATRTATGSATSAAWRGSLSNSPSASARSV